MDGEEIGRVAQLADQPQLMLEQVRDSARGTPSGYLRCERLPGQPLQRLLRRAARHHDLVGILVAQLAQREGAALGDVGGGADRVREGA